MCIPGRPVFSLSLIWTSDTKDDGMTKRLVQIFGVLILLTYGVTCAPAETFHLTDGTVLNGELVSPGELGAVISQPDGSYSPRIHWSRFSQEDLKRLAQNPRLKQFVEPFIDEFEESPGSAEEEKPIQLKPVNRIPAPDRSGFLSALFGTPLGLAIVVVLYLANIYAAYEVAVVRARPPLAVCGLAAVLPVVAPLIFLLSPTRVRAEERLAAEEAAAAQSQAQVAAELASASAAILGTGQHKKTTGLAELDVPPTQLFRRGEYVFNRRFFETKFPGFFTIVRRESEKDLVLTLRTNKGLFQVERFTRITASDMHALVRRGSSVSEIQIPFSDVTDVELRHKTVPSQLE